MCLIVTKPQGLDFKAEYVRRAATINSDRFGLMYTCDDPKCHTVHVCKTLGGPEKILKLYRPLKTRAMAMHFRMATHGLKNEENAHPVPVLTQEEHGVDLYMMHNGVLQFVQNVEPKMSDTYNFAKYWLRPILAEDPDLLHNATFQKMLTQVIGKYNKLVFLDGEGRFVTINEGAGTHLDGCWLSNEYSVHQPYAYASAYDDTKAWAAWDTKKSSWMTKYETEAKKKGNDFLGLKPGQYMQNGRVYDLHGIQVTPKPSTGANVLELPPPSKSAKESADALLASAAIKSSEDFDGSDHDGWAWEDSMDEPALQDDLELDEAFFQGAKWQDVFEEVVDNPVAIADFIHQRFA